MIKMKLKGDIISIKHRDMLSYLHYRRLKDSSHCGHEWELLLEFQVWMQWNHHLFSFLIILGGFTGISFYEPSRLLSVPGVWHGSGRAA